MTVDLQERWWCRPAAHHRGTVGEELREDPGDHFVALAGRHLPALLHHRGPVAVGLIRLGTAKLVAAASWEGQEWGGYLLAATVALLLPLTSARPLPPRRPAMSRWRWRMRPYWGAGVRLAAGVGTT